ncbi:hypothetical protein L7F22_003953 [Adiantum nelumboides]|nr:hypothetical protein [Adiantum nelumboides]
MSTSADPCPHCERLVPAANAELHAVHCRRHLERCALCGDMVTKRRAEEHYAEVHAPVTCLLCHQDIERPRFEQHQTDECERRLVACSFCEFPLAAVDMEVHAHHCGNRTEFCIPCRSYILLRYRAAHDLHYHNGIKDYAPLQASEDSSLSDDDHHIMWDDGALETVFGNGNLEVEAHHEFAVDAEYAPRYIEYRSGRDSDDYSIQYENGAYEEDTDALHTFGNGDQREDDPHCIQYSSHQDSSDDCSIHEYACNGVFEDEYGNVSAHQIDDSINVGDQNLANPSTGANSLHNGSIPSQTTPGGGVFAKQGVIIMAALGLICGAFLLRKGSNTKI